MSLDILRVLGTRENHDRFIEVVKKHNLFSNKHKIIFDGISDYYEAFPNEEDIDWDKFETWFWVSHPTMKQEKRDLYNIIMEKIREELIDSDLEQKVIEEMTKRSYAADIAEKALKITDGQKIELDEITTIIDAYETEVGGLKEDSHVVSDDLDALINTTIAGGGLDWRLEYLNQMVGPVRKGDLCLIGARPEAGKTTFLASEGTYFAKQFKEGQKLIWFNNEEEGNKVKLRIVQAALGWTTEKIVTTPSVDVVAAFEAEMGRSVSECVLVYDKARITLRDIDRVLAKNEAGLIIFDQLRKVVGFNKASNELARLAGLYQYARELAKEVAPVVTVHQARGDAEGVKYIAQNQLEGSQTEIQGELDLQIMIGRSLDPSFEHNRYFNIVKNKLSGGPKTIKALRHGQFECVIEPDIARYSMPSGILYT